MLTVRASASALASLLVGLGPSSAQTTVSLPVDSGILSAPVVSSTFDRLPTLPAPFHLGPIRPLNPEYVKPIESGPPNPMVVESAVSNTSPMFTARFPGIGHTQYEPADPCIAVSYSNIVQVVNSDIAFYDKQGNLQFNQSLDNSGFFSGVAQTDFVYDPKVIFDHIAKRFFVIALEWSDTPHTSGLLIAVSDDANPNGTWYKYRLDTKVTQNGTDYWFDYPGVGYGKSGVVITGNMFKFDNSYGFARSYALPKTTILSGGLATFYVFDHPGDFTIQPTRNIEGISTNVFGVSIKNSSTFTVYAWKNIASTPSLAQTDVTVPQFVPYASDAVSTGGTTLDPVADRMMDATFWSGHLFCAHTVKVSNTDNRCMVRWYELASSTWPDSGSMIKRQTGNIALSSPNYVFMPAISRNGKGAVTLIVTRCSPTRTADLLSATRASTDRLNTMGPLKLIKASQHSPTFTNNRWGDFFSVTIDPSDSSKFWGCGMVIGPDGLWRTEISSWSAN